MIFSRGTSEARRSSADTPQQTSRSVTTPTSLRSSLVSTTGAQPQPESRIARAASAAVFFGVQHDDAWIGFITSLQQLIFVSPSVLEIIGESARRWAQPRTRAPPYRLLVVWWHPSLSEPGLALRFHGSPTDDQTDRDQQCPGQQVSLHLPDEQRASQQRSARLTETVRCILRAEGHAGVAVSTALRDQNREVGEMKAIPKASSPRRATTENVVCAIARSATPDPIKPKPAPICRSRRSRPRAN